MSDNSIFTSYGRSFSERLFFFIGGSVMTFVVFGPKLSESAPPPGLFIAGLVGGLALMLSILPQGRLSRQGNVLRIPVAPFFVWYRDVQLRDVKKLSFRRSTKRWSNGGTESTVFIVLELESGKALLDLSKMNPDGVRILPAMLGVESDDFLLQLSQFVRTG